MAHYFGNKRTGSAYYGSVKIGQIYKGSQLVYQSAFNVTYVVDTGVSYTEKVKPKASMLSPKTFTPVKSGWTFVGWRTDKTASSSVLTSASATGHTTLYAVFKQSVTVSYAGNGATSGSTTAHSAYKYYNNGNTVGAAFKLKSSGFAKAAHKFNKWAQGSASGTQYSVDASVTLTANTTFYAVWTAVTTNAWSGTIESYGSSISPEKPFTIGTFDLTGFGSITLDIEVKNPNLEAEVWLYIGETEVIRLKDLQFNNTTDVSKTVDISGYTGNKTIAIGASGIDGKTTITGVVTLSV